jgi:hypothetical protein
MLEQRLYAFWRYDGFPTRQCLGGEVSKFVKDGFVERIGSLGYFYRPFKICLLQEGVVIQAQLDHLDIEYKKELDKLKRKYSQLHNQILEVPK